MKLTIYCHSYLLSEGLKKLLEDEPLVGEIEVKDGHELKKGVHPVADLILADLDIFLDHADEFFHKGRSKVLVINNTAHLPLLNGQLSEYISKGLVGILSPETDASLLKRAIRAVYSGELWINHKSLKELIVSGPQKSGLTKQEGQVVYYICRGYRNKEIARKLDIAEQTVKSHCNRLYKKLGVSDRLQLALLFMYDKSLKSEEGERAQRASFESDDFR